VLADDPAAVVDAGGGRRGEQHRSRERRLEIDTVATLDGIHAALDCPGAATTNARDGVCCVGR
jgi:hypothetical protein